MFDDASELHAESDIEKWNCGGKALTAYSQKQPAVTLSFQPQTDDAARTYSGS